MNFRTIIGLLIALVIVIFSIQNAEVTDVKFFIWKLSMSRVLIILGSFAIGVLVGYLLSLRKIINKK
ncbi:lipopolysaccharide assembly protein LapA domain-containing protein [Mariniflexile gromovii]|uniref:LapA family protein n=1 Tax=Mariniflexile gromovii TaxID=362523 RepID=A0ABS4BNZ2_9FLAO|nr:LapA family protein [Mariniflexile gromovii]MBP0902324.1 LapA family protein [Mariniflexile gromovii]